MKIKWPFYFILFSVLVFFYKFFFHKLIPIPANLLVNWFFPWNTLPGFGTPYKGIIAMDAVRQMLPWKHFLASHMSFWNPYNFSGQPLMANIQSAFFYPLTWFYLIFSDAISWTLGLILSYLLGMFFMYFYLRKIGLKEAAALFGSLAFVASAFFTKWAEFVVVNNSFIWLPLGLAAIELIKSKKRYGYMLLALSLTMSVFGGHIQTALYVWLMTIVYGWVLLWKTNRKQVLKVFVVFFLAFLISGIQIFPSAELYLKSARGSIANLDKYYNYLMPYKYFIAQLVPDFFGNEGAGNFWGKEGTFNTYIGVVAMFFLPFIFLLKKRRRQLVFFIAVVLVCALMATPNPTSFMVQKSHLPLLSSSDPSRILMLFQFAMAVLAAIGFDNFISAKKKKIIFAIPLAVVYFFILTYFYLFNPSWISEANLVVVKRNLILPVVIYGLTFFITFLILKLSKKIGKVLVFLCLVLALGEYWYAFNKFEPFSESKFIFPETEIVNFLKQNSGRERFAGTNNARISNNFATYFELNSPEGYDPLFPKRYGMLVNFVKTGELTENISRSDVELPLTIDGQKEQRLLNLLAVKYLTFRELNPNLIGKQNTLFDNQIYKKVWEKDANQIYENSHYLSRVSLIGSTEYIDNDKKLLSSLFDPDFQPDKTVLLEEETPFWFQQGDLEKSELKVVELSADNLKISTNATKSAVLWLGDVYYPGWKVKVDGKENKIYQANFVFRAVLLPAGEHEVEFAFFPNYFEWYLVAAAGSLLVLCYMSFFPYEKKV